MRRYTRRINLDFTQIQKEHDMENEISEFFDAYVETAIWSSYDESDESGGSPMDENYDSDDIAPQTLADMRADCVAFYTANRADIQDESSDYSEGDSPIELRRASMAGHNFWLNRNGHGAGFWDGDYSESIGQRLSDASGKFGEFDLYIGDDSKIWGM